MVSPMSRTSAETFRSVAFAFSIVSRSGLASTPAGPDEAAAEAVPAEGEARVDDEGPGRAENRVSEQVGHVVAEGAEVADVDRRALQFQGGRPGEAGPGHPFPAPGEAFHGLAIGEAVADRGVARDGLGEDGLGPPVIVVLLEEAFDSPGADSRAEFPGDRRVRRGS